MAVTKGLTKTVPYSNPPPSSKVQRWILDYTYENDSEGDPTYYANTFHIVIEATDPVTGVVNFTPKAKASWTNAQLVALCPISLWDSIFADQVEVVITNPPTKDVPDDDFPVPS